MTEPERPLLDPLDDAAGPAVPMSKAEIEAMVQAAMAEGLAAPAPAPAPAPTRVPFARLFWIAAALMISVAAAAAFGTYVGVQVGLREHAPPPTPPPAPAPESALPATGPASSTQHAPEVAPVPEVAPAPEIARSPEVAPTPEIAPSSGAPAPRASADATSSEDLLLLANRLRARREWRAAAQTYERIVARDDASDERYVAVVALASLQLEHLDRPRSARRLYQTALRLRPTGALSEEASYGVASTYRVEGRDAEERRALEAYLAAHPSGLLVAQARARLASLGATP